MLIHYAYVRLPEWSGDVLRDIRGLLTLNGEEKTLRHVQDVAEACARIARQYGLDERRCALSGWLHDVSAVLRPADMLCIAEERGWEIDPAERAHPFLLHQRISEIMAREAFHMADDVVLSAVACHTTLKAAPSAYDMALFLADKLAWDQAGVPPFAGAVRSALQVSLEEASLRYIDYVLDHGMILCPHRLLLEARSFLRERMPL